jgi:multidrug efflux pump
MARFFIDRPVIAWVLAILTMLTGVISLTNLPVSQYPTISPTTVSISARYLGASAQTVEDSVTQIIEKNMTGLDYLRYMSSTSDAYGNATVTLTFDSEADPDIAQVQVQNKLQSALPSLPSEVQNQGIVIQKSNTGYFMVIALYSEDSGLTRNDIADYVVTNIQDPISRITGVGNVRVFGSQYAMRIWLDPFKLTQFNLTAIDVADAIREQNAQVSSGQFGDAPAQEEQLLNATISASSRLSSVEEFENIILKSDISGANVYLKDVARIERGSESYSVDGKFNGYAASGLGLSLGTGANALETSQAVKERLEQLQQNFPEGLKLAYVSETTPFVQASIKEVVKTLLEAVALVFLIMYLFLQNFRATLIPTIAVPVVLLGTFALLYVTGLSINTLTMFAMVLAIGLLVDDAIVVVESVERVMHEDGLEPKEATKKSMGQITSALVGVGLTLSAVFVPMAFMSGSTGVIYRQFSITIVAAMVLSVLVAIILTPALCATLLKKGDAEFTEKKGFFGWFNRKFDYLTTGYESGVAKLLKRTGRMMLLFIALTAGAVWFLINLPTSFLPDEDQGTIYSMVILPPNSTQAQTEKVLENVRSYYLEDEKDVVESLFTVSGVSFAGQGQNMGMAFINLKDWSERPTSEMDAGSLAGRAMRYFSNIKEAFVFAFAPPPIRELGNATGFDFYLQDTQNQGHQALVAAQGQLLGLAAQNPKLVGVRPNGLSDAPMYQIHVDHAKLRALNVSISDVNRTLSTAWGGAYINDYIDRGRVKRVMMQSDIPYRMQPKDFDSWYVRNSNGDMVAFSAFSYGEWSYGSPQLKRFDGLPALNIQGGAAPGVSTGDAMAQIDAIVAQLPAGFEVKWNGISYEERLSGSQANMLYALSILVVFLVLAALYNSWSVPLSVVLVVPLGVLGAVLAVMGRGMDNDVFFQVSLLTTVGLATKNAILIVEFAKQYYENGADLIDATLHAVRVRLRPIIMTSLAFGLGVVPLTISSGVGSAAQNAVGTGVLGGMISATLLGIFFVPIFFVVVERIFDRRAKRERDSLVQKDSSTIES